MRRLIVTFFSIASLIACIDRVELPIRTEEPRLVIEGQITNEAPPYTVRLTYTGRYGGEGGQNPASQYVQNAQVSLASDQGRSVRFLGRGQGIYQTTDTTFRGQVGRAYSLTVALSDGKRYITKPERMPAVPPIDSISARLIRDNNFNTPYQYAYAVTTRDPASAQNYYRWTAYGLTVRKSTGVPCSLGSPAICFDNCYTTVSGEDINIYNDVAINGNSIPQRVVFQLPIYAVWPQWVEVQQYGITQSNYQFWKLYQQQRARTGSIFDPLPAPVTGNLVNATDPSDLARGYFAVTSMTRRRIRNEATEARTSTAVYGFLASQPVPQGDCRRTYGLSVPVTLPAGWP